MAPVSTLERVTFECARCGGTIDRMTRPKTCPHCSAKKADRCQLCDRAVHIGFPLCPEHAASPEPDRTEATPPAPPPAPAPPSLAPRWAAAAARVAVALTILAPAGLLVRSQTQLRKAESYDDLRSMLATHVPGRYDQVPDEQSGRGPLDFDKVVAEDIEGPAARAFLTEAELLRGYGRVYRDGSDDTESVSVELYQYGSADGARMDVARAERLVPQVAAGDGLSWQTFGVPTVPDARGYSLSAPDGRASVEIVTFARGPYAAAVAVTSADRDEAREVAVSVAEDQRAKLSKGERVERLVVDAFRLLRDES